MTNENIKFGPSGLGPVKEALKRLEEYDRLGFRACEIAFTYGIYVKEERDAKLIGEKASELGIELTIHGPYYINLNSAEPEKIEASKKRILDCCKIGEIMGAKAVVFHPGFYGKAGKADRAEAYETIKKNMLELQKEVEKNGWKIKLAPETMGKVNVFGSVEEISKLVKETGCSFCIDYAHILARDKTVDFQKIETLFPDSEWHVHFSGIEYNEKGERRHIETPEKAIKELLGKLPKDS
jgi:deoxyribonuclease IV